MIVTGVHLLVTTTRTRAAVSNLFKLCFVLQGADGLGEVQKRYDLPRIEGVALQLRMPMKRFHSRSLVFFWVEIWVGKEAVRRMF
jgi:hypothetical protein